MNLTPKFLTLAAQAFTLRGYAAHFWCSTPDLGIWLFLAARKEEKGAEAECPDAPAKLAVRQDCALR